MHVLIGLLVTVAAFVASQMVHDQVGIGGLLNPGALVLLAVGPWGVSMIAHPFSSWRSNLVMMFRAFGHDMQGNLQSASEDMMQLGRAVREARWSDAEAVIRASRTEHVRNLAPHLLERLEPDALQEALANTSFRWLAKVKASDDFLQGLARLSPAFGMIGTIMGLVDLFKNMRDSASLGPGMAMALLATLYGLILCYCVYMPLAQRVRTYLVEGTQEQRVIERAMHLVVDGRPIHEIRGAILDGQITSFVAEPRASEAR